MTDKLAEILDDVQEFATRFIAYPTTVAAPVHALWVAHTHLVDAFENTPRLAFLSPEPGSGKSRAMEITEALVPRPVLSVNASVAYVFRKISDPEGLPTLLMDEADAVFSHKKADGNEDLRGLLNSGYRKGATAGRVVMRGNEQIPEDWPSFCPVALAGLNELPDTLMSRSIVVPMKKRRPDQVVQPYRRRTYGHEAAELAARLHRAARRHFDEVRDAWPKLPPGIEDRDADIWEPLVAIADAAGGHWPLTAREAATQLVTTAKAKPQTLGVKLLADLRDVFKDRETMLTTDLLGELIRIDASPWGSIKGEPIDARFLARTLSKYEVPTNQTVRTAKGRGKGYKRADLFDAWERYLPPLTLKVGDMGDNSDAPSQPVTVVTDYNTSRSSPEKWCSDLS
ncbi:DUF3631 domain-containing protein [Kocuria sp. UCD-OTCP]|uniref:DUF3631 domain-containing protein n=1 Tax=Kocuria sp. UCD-OTCP TaxID=1292021 RepID=UPI000377B31F|nr:DUF3631 domain-containing protein [Kocuria sp. UCD-OTCP]EYT53520.1 hypothetical protein H488_0106050 [Kocuria sp. UCD-OTCP]